MIKCNVTVCGNGQQDSDLPHEQGGQAVRELCRECGDSCKERDKQDH